MSFRSKHEILSSFSNTARRTSMLPNLPNTRQIAHLPSEPPSEQTFFWPIPVFFPLCKKSLHRRACRARTADVCCSLGRHRRGGCVFHSYCGRKGHRQQARHGSVLDIVSHGDPARGGTRGTPRGGFLRTLKHLPTVERAASLERVSKPPTPLVEAAQTHPISLGWLDLYISFCRLDTCELTPLLDTPIKVAGESSFRPRTRYSMAAVVVDEAGVEPPVLPEDPPYPTWWPLEESLAARGRRLPIYTFASQFAGEHESVLFNGDGNDDQNREELSPEQVTDVDFLRGLNLQGLEAGGAAPAPLRRVMVSPAAAAAAGGGKKSRYDEDNPPTPATLVADLKATGNFKSAITDMDDDGSGAPLPYLGYLVFPCADEVHEDDEKQYIFTTSEDLAEAIAEAESEVVDSEADEGGMGAEAYREITLRSRAQLAALKQYVLKQRVFYVLIHSDRREHCNPGDQDMSTDVILLALGVSPATGNLVGVIAIQVCHNLCD